MAKVAEGIARVAGGIATGRRRRSELASEIKALTRSRHNDVRSLLTNMKTSRGQASRAQAAEMRKVTRARHGEVKSLLTSLKTSRRKAGLEQAAEAKKVASKRHGDVCASLDGLKASRVRADREYRKEATVVIGARRDEVKTLLGRFSRELSARRRRRLELLPAQRQKAAAFMRDLTNGVAGLLGEFARNDRDRATSVRERLAAYALDRSDAVAIWRGKPRPSEHEAGARHRPAAETSSAHPKSPASESAPAKPDEKAAAQSPEPAGRSPESRWPKSPIGRHGGSK